MKSQQTKRCAPSIVSHTSTQLLNREAIHETLLVVERGKKISSSWGISINIMLPVQFLECILNLFIAKNIACNIGEFCAELLWRERKDWLFYYYCKAAADGRGTLLCYVPCTHRTTLWSCSRQFTSKQKAKGGTLMQKKGVFIHAQAQTLIGEEYQRTQKQQPWHNPLLFIYGKHMKVWFWRGISKKIMRFSLAICMKLHPKEEFKIWRCSLKNLKGIYFIEFGIRCNSEETVHFCRNGTSARCYKWRERQLG